MNQIFDKQLTITNSTSIIGFENVGDGAWPRWNRYLTIEGKHAYDMGNICGTCSFFFERLGGANRGIAADDLINAFRDGFQELDESLMNTASQILPTGAYWPGLLDMSPYKVKLGTQNDYFVNEQVKLWGVDGFWNLPHYPKVEYYRGRTTDMGNKKQLIEFVIPMVPDSWLRNEDVQMYAKKIIDSKQPTAFAISVLDVKEPAEWDEEQSITTHYCLAHYLLDGHHKTFAASQVQKPITLLSFLAVDECIASDEQIQEVLQIFKREIL